MSPEEQILVCKAVARSCMWGHGGIASNIVERLQTVLPTDPNWYAVYSSHLKPAQYEAVGVIKDEAELQRWLGMGYWLCNYNPGERELALFNPPPMNGLHMYVLGDLADKYGRTHGGRP